MSRIKIPRADPVPGSIEWREEQKLIAARATRNSRLSYEQALSNLEQGVFQEAPRPASRMAIEKRIAAMGEDHRHQYSEKLRLEEARDKLHRVIFAPPEFGFTPQQILEAQKRLPATLEALATANLMIDVSHHGMFRDAKLLEMMDRDSSLTLAPPADPREPQHEPAPPADLQKLRTESAGIFHGFMEKLASVRMTNAVALPLTASAALIATGIGMEVQGQSVLLEQGLSTLRDYQAFVESTTPTQLGDLLKAGLKGQLESFGGNEVVRGMVGAGAAPLVAVAAVAISRGYLHLKEWLGQQSPALESMPESTISASRDFDPR